MEYNLENIFTYHSPTENQQIRYSKLREEAKMFAAMILSGCPDSAERTLALRKVEEAVMWANASIARNENLNSQLPGQLSMFDYD